jgi:N,N-dimethylformamidase
MYKRMAGYVSAWSAEAGSSLSVHVSCDGVDAFDAELVRLIHGDTNPEGPGFKEIATGLRFPSLPGRSKSIYRGSFIRVPDALGKLGLPSGLTVHAFVFAAFTGCRQGILSRRDAVGGPGWALLLDADGRLRFEVGNGKTTEGVSSTVALATGVWYSVAGGYDPASKEAYVWHMPVISRHNSRVGLVADKSGPLTTRAEVGLEMTAGRGDVLIAAGRNGASDAARAMSEGFNGRIAQPRVFGEFLDADALRFDSQGRPQAATKPVAAWDFAAAITPEGVGTDRVDEAAGSGLEGRCYNTPERGYPGPFWQGHESRFVSAPREFDAIQFHDDDLEDCGWDPDLTFRIPDLPSGVYAVKLSASDAEDYVPFVVRPRLGEPGARAVFLLPTASYLAYANSQIMYDFPMGQLAWGRTAILSANDLNVADRRKLGLSVYDLHKDGMGVAMSSSLRPMLDVRPKHYSYISGSAWQFNADLYIVDWLYEQGFDVDVVTDHDLHREGTALLAPYRVVLTGSHPEYYTEEMLDAMEDYVAAGGRLMYLGANGFYWVVAFHPEHPHVLELRRGENGTRTWQAPPGTCFNSFNGRAGGLWRNRGRAPQKLAGVGFCAQGFDSCSPYRRQQDSYDPKAAFIFEGVSGTTFGDYGLMGHGAAGVEVDRYELKLGTPPDALLLASSYRLSDNYMRVTEEVETNQAGMTGTEDPFVRADMVYFTNQAGGAVFSTGSIAWAGSLSHNGYNNDVSRITRNVLNRFVE